jgi:RNA polymerase sigma factor (sigma-70 family)
MDDDQGAFETLVRRHGPMVLRVCLRTLGHIHDAEDALQATFLVLARQATSIRAKESLASWLHGVAYRMARHAKRAAVRRHKHESRAKPAQPRDPALTAAWQELQVLLDEEIDGLPETLRAPFVSCCLENKSSAETAQQLGLTDGTVCMRLSRARKLLQKRLTRRGVSLATALAAAAVSAGDALASVPHTLVGSTAKAAAQIAAGHALAGGQVPVKVITLMQGLSHTMFLSKCKAALFLLIGAGVAGVGLGLTALHAGAKPLPVAQQTPQQAPRERSKTEPPPPAAAPAPTQTSQKAGGRTRSDIPPEVRQALQRNAQAFAPIALTTEKQRSAPHAESALSKAILGTFPGCLKACTYEYLAQDGFCYARYNQWVQGGRRIGNTEEFTKELMPMWQEFSWDGKCAYLGSQSLQPQILEIVPIEKFASDGHFKIVTWYDADDYFPMIGITAPRTMKDLRDGTHSEILQLLAGGGRVTKTGTERSTVGTEDFVIDLLSGEKKHRFWLDPSRGYAVRRHEVSALSLALALAIENSDFIRLTDPELWLPRHCHAEWHMWPWVADKEFSRETGMAVDIQATRLERTHVPPEQFTLKYDKPGSYISDARLPGAGKKKDGRVDYIVPADPVNLKEVVEAAQDPSGYTPPRRPRYAWIVGGGTIALAALFGAMVLIRRRQGRGTP